MQSSVQQTPAPAPPSAPHEKILSDFPTLIPANTNFTRFTGFITISNTPFRISISSDLSTFSADASLGELLKPVLPVLKQSITTCQTAHEFLLELRDLTERQIKKATSTLTDAPTPLITPPAAFYETLLNQISNIGWSKVTSLSSDMLYLSLTIQDSNSHSHTLTLNLPANFPSSPPQCLASLPVPFTPTWSHTCTLSSLVDQFRSQVESFQPFFSAMHDLDTHTHILEPPHPTTGDTYRRLLLDTHTSLRLDLNPHAPLKAFPECRFLGSEAAITPYKRLLNENIHLWDTSGNILPRQNLETVLKLKLPKPPATNSSQDLGIECGICYAYRLDDKLPDVVCDLAECGKPYHRQCLVEWLRALPDSRENFGTISGNCVYCERGISVALSE